MSDAATGSPHYWARIVHILLAVQLLPLTAIHLYSHQVIGMGFIPVGFSTAIASMLLRMRSHGEQELHPAAVAVLDSVITAGLFLVLTAAFFLAVWAEEVGLMQVYTGVLMNILLALHMFLAIRGWHNSKNEAGYAPVPKADKTDKV